MIQRIYRIVFVLFVVAGSVRLSAQTAGSSDVGVWLVGSKLAESTLVDEGDSITLDFDEKLGYGVSFNHFWTDAFSTEIAAQKFGADLIVSDNLAPSPDFNVADVDITSITAMGQLHFMRASRFSPYVGAGIARISGDFDPIDDPDDPESSGTFDLESETTWTAAVGANLRINDHFFFVGELKYIPWSAVAEDDPASDSIDVDPLTFAAGVKVRF
jgi:outer membrane protein W